MKLTYNDEEHAYWLDGKRCKGVTSVAKFPDDTFKIEQWRQRQIVIGMAMSPPLVHRAAAHFDERDKIQAIAKEAADIAKANEASGRGIANHKITERIDLGLDWIDTPEARAVIAAWTAALDHAGLEIDPALVEQIVVYPQVMVAGRFDRIARYRHTGRPVIVDVKTGEGAVKYPHSTCVQLALYANAPLMATNLRRRQNRDGKWIEWTDTFQPLPADLHRDHAIVVYLPPEGPAQPYRVNINRGWEQAATAICFPTIQWRNIDKADLIEPLNTELVATVERCRWIRRRVHDIVDAGHEPELAGLWDTSIIPAPLRADSVLTDAQIDTLVGWCTGIEALAGLPFEPTDPNFIGFIPTEPPPAPAPEPPGNEARLELARVLVDRAKAILAEFDEPQQVALIKWAGIDPKATMTADWVRDLEALATEIADLDGGVIFNYGHDGADIVPTPTAEARMVAAAGSRGEARDRAARLAKQAGHIAPRALTQAAQNPLLVALVAQGHGAQDNNTVNNGEHVT